VGAKLLDRSGGKVSVTASGKLFQKFAEQMVGSRKAMLTAIAETERVPRGEIVVGAKVAAPGGTAEAVPFPFVACLYSNSRTAESRTGPNRG
jgi:DNA-binding transcriptional LysR family regulator